MQVSDRFSRLQEGTFVIKCVWQKMNWANADIVLVGLRLPLTNGSQWRVHLNKADLNGHTSEIKSCMAASGACWRISCPQGKSAKALMNFYQR